MDYNQMVNLISNIGFPIACVIILFFMQYKEDIMHNDEVEKLRTTIENNTKVMEKVLIRLEGIENDLDKRD